MKNKRKIKKFVLGTAIILAAILLVIVLIVSLQFNKKGENIDLSPETPIQKEEEHIIFTNDSDYTETEIEELITQKRNDFINFFKEAKYYNISEIDSTYSEEENENWMVLDNEFLSELQSFISDDLYTQLTQPIELLKTEEDKVYYKAPRNTFENLFYESAIASLETNHQEIILIYASETQISARIKIQICEENEYNLCRRDDEYQFCLEKVNDEWFISSILNEETDEDEV